MTPQAWLAEVERRIRISEGCQAKRYYDTQGVATIGIGFNLERADAYAALEHCGCADPSSVLAGTMTLAPAQIDALFAYSFAPIQDQARASLAPGIFEALTDARRFVVCDLVYNLGNEGWLGFAPTRALINAGQAAKNALDLVRAHDNFEAAADHLTQSAWYGQVADRAKRDVAMLRVGIFCDASGDGSDIV